MIVWGFRDEIPICFKLADTVRQIFSKVLNLREKWLVQILHIPGSTVAFFATVQSEGGRMVSREIYLDGETTYISMIRKLK